MFPEAQDRQPLYDMVGEALREHVMQVCERELRDSLTSDQDVAQTKGKQRFLRDGKVIDLSNRKPKNPRFKQNCKAGGEQTVSPIRTYEEVLRITNWLYQNKDHKYVLAFVLGVNVGLRANELLALRMNQVFNPDGTVRSIEDLNDTDDVIYVYQGKTDKNRPIFLNTACKRILLWYFGKSGSDLYSDDFLFPSREGGCIQVGTFRKVLKEAAEACGIKENVGTHTCRKTFAYNVWQQTPDIRTDITVLQALLGHSSPQITMRYLGLDRVEFKKIYYKLKLDVANDTRFLGANEVIHRCYGEN